MPANQPPALWVGRLLRAGTTGFIAGCAVTQFDAPSLGALVRAPVEENYTVYGLIYDIHIDDDGLVRQLVTSENVSDEIMKDNRERRIVPVEMSVLSVGYEQNGKIQHLLPPRPPLSLDRIFLCTAAELVRFTETGHFGYFRHILRAKDTPLGEILAAHIQQAGLAHTERFAKQIVGTFHTELMGTFHTERFANIVPTPALASGAIRRFAKQIANRVPWQSREQIVGTIHGVNGEQWKEAATRELITLLRDDYPTLMSVLGALGEIQ